MEAAGWRQQQPHAHLHFAGVARSAAVPLHRDGWICSTAVHRLARSGRAASGSSNVGTAERGAELLLLLLALVVVLVVVVCVGAMGGESDRCPVCRPRDGSSLARGRGACHSADLPSEPPYVCTGTGRWVGGAGRQMAAADG